MRILKKLKPRYKQEKWPITVWFDDREKKGRWHLNCDKYKMVKKRLVTGDYTIEGYEKRFCIERKAHLQEFIGNISGQKKHKFKQYLERLSQVECACIIVEESLEQLPLVLATMSHSQLKPKDVYFWIGKIMFEYGIPIIFHESKGHAKQEFLYYIFDSALQTLKG